MELRQLEYFVEVSKHKSFTHAAECLHVSQPSISNSLHKLEDELGVKLLERTTKNVSLTYKGELFLNRIVTILANMNEAICEVSESDNGVVKIGLPPMIGAQMFPNVFIEFKQKYSNIQFDVIEKGSVAIRNLIETGELEMGFIILPQSSECLDMIPFVQDELVICMQKGHPLSSRKVIDCKDLAEERFVMMTAEYVHHNMLLNHCLKSNVQPNIIFTSDKVETVRSMVGKGLGISLLMDMYVKDHHDIVAVPLKSPLKINIGLAWKKGRQLSSECKKVIEFFSHYFKDENIKKAQ
ncbi:LysR family transcriptional regulator [Cytobacillus sp. FJAT-54145]|uniref:LysR family transcriptional regulator n=1 Tax=Cytobacillus spartinae TaxID=3299023 RepID=A0ABW6KBB2_9BACI